MIKCLHKEKKIYLYARLCNNRDGQVGYIMGIRIVFLGWGSVKFQTAFTSCMNISFNG